MRKPERRRVHVFIAATFGLFLLIVLLLLSFPLFHLIWASLNAAGIRGLTLINYRQLFQSEQTARALSNSIAIALQSSLIAVILAIPCVMAMLNIRGEGLRRRFLLLVNLRASFHGGPLVLAAGLLVGTGGVLARAYEVFGAQYAVQLVSPAGLLACYVYFQLPLAVLLLYPVFLGIQPDWRQAASVLGAYSRQFWLRIGLPITLPSLITSFAVLFAHAMGSYATAYLLTVPDYPLLPLVISAYITSGPFAQPGLGSALAVLLAAALVLAMLLGEWAGSIAEKGREIG